MRLKRQTATGATWRCDACGAFNDEPDTICSECSAQRLEMPPKPKTPELRGTENEVKDFEIPETNVSYAEKAIDEPSNIFTEPDETKEESQAATEEEEEPEVEKVESIQEPEEEKAQPQEFEFPSRPEPKTFTSPTPGQGRYYFVFVSSPATSLVKSKVSIDFDTFPTISIGRSPENIIVLPDQEVSRKHAELTMDGDRLMLKDLQSKNGTYLYDGKKFQQVSGSVEVKPNSVVKFGTGTIVRLTGE